MSAARLLSAISDLQEMTEKLVEGAIDPQENTRRRYSAYALGEIIKQAEAIRDLVEHGEVSDGR